MKTEELDKLREEVKDWCKEHPGSGLIGDIPNRSCWECNPCHEWMKDIDYPIQCLFCGRTFYKGVDVTIYEYE